MRIVEIPFTYPVTFVPRGGRAERTARIRATAPVPFAEPGDGECPVAVTIALNPRHRPTDYEAPPSEARYHAWAGALVAERTVWNGDLSADTSIFAPDWDDAIPSEEFVPRKLVASGEAEARAGVLAKAAGMCLLNGRLMEPVPEPVWIASAFRGVEQGRIMISTAPTPDLAGPEARAFRIDRLEDALDHARFMACATFGREGIVVGTHEAVRIEPGAPLRFDGLVDGGPRFVRDLEDLDLGKGFHRLPGDCLRAWARYRDAVPGALAGDPLALRDAFEALGAVADALPTPRPRDEFDTLRRVVCAEVRAYRTYEAHRPVDPEDGESLAALAGP